MIRRSSLAPLVSLFALACAPPSPAVRPSRDASLAPPLPAARGVRFEHASPEGPVEPLVRAAQSNARREGRALLVYVGATWCEPCQYFHRAVDRGALDREFPALTLLEFDLDRDNARLRAAGYASEMIPLFAVPAPDGRASGRHIEGSIHGEGSVREISDRLRPLLAP